MTAGERSQGQGQGDAAVAAARAGLQAAGGAAPAAAEEIRAQTKQVAVREGQPDLTGEGMALDNANEAEQPEDSKDEKPLAYRKKVLQMAATHGGKSGDDKPPVPETPAAAVGKKGVVTGKLDSGTAAMKVMGRKMAGKQEAESATGKRPLEDKAGSPNAAKKLKPSVPAKASGAAKAKEEPDFHDSDEDDIPLAQRRALRKVSEAPVKDGNSGIKRPLDGKGSTSHTPAAKKVKPSAKEEPAKGKAEVGKGRQSGKAKDEPAKVKEESLKREPDPDNDDDDDVPLAQRVSASKAVSVKKVSSSSGAKVATKKVQETKTTRTRQVEKTVKKKVVVADKNGGGGQKWSTLEHNGVIFPPPYQPHGVKMLYDGKPVDLTERQEEVATMFAVMKDTEYASKERFITNFWNDWKPLLGPGHVIKKFELCDFTPIYEWNLQEKEKKKLMSTEEKKRLKEEKLKMEEKYMWALVDGVKEKVGNFRVEPPGLFRGRGDHPKMGKLKKRIQPKDIVINVGKDAPIPECPIPNTKWKEVRHDNTVTWLAYWNDPINPKDFKYVGLAASSSLKGQSDKEKYEKARLLKDYIDDIRKTYTKNFTSQDMTKRQISVATYLIDRLALRAGNEKDEEEADTVGCCSLKVEHVSLVPPRSLEFDFLGKDSIRYNNTVEVEEKVYKAIGDFKKGKKEGQDLFDKLDTNKLNAHLKEIMPNLTAKVFRTYNASITLDNLLFEEESEGTTVEKIADYQRANKEVAILCNHQRTVSKTHGAQMEKLQTKMADIEAALEELTSDLEKARKGRSLGKDKEGKPKRNMAPEMIEKKIAQHTARLDKMKVDMSMKDDLKTVALGTSKINYMDPRITVAWCKRHEVPIEKIFNKSLLAKFAWAMDVEPDYRF